MQMMLDQCVQTDGMDEAYKLKVAVDRALRAEKAYLRLKKEMFDEKIKNDLKLAEQDYMAKTKLYSALPEQLKRIQNEFQKESSELVGQGESATKVFILCEKALNSGLTMDELPLTTEDAEDVENIILTKLRDKEQQSSLSNGVSSGGGTQKIRNGTTNQDPAAVLQGQVSGLKSNAIGQVYGQQAGFQIPHSYNQFASNQMSQQQIVQHQRQQQQQNMLYQPLNYNGSVLSHPQAMHTQAISRSDHHRGYIQNQSNPWPQQSQAAQFRLQSQQYNALQLSQQKSYNGGNMPTESANQFDRAALLSTPVTSIGGNASFGLRSSPPSVSPPSVSISKISPLVPNATNEFAFNNQPAVTDGTTVTKSNDVFNDSQLFSFPLADDTQVRRSEGQVSPPTSTMNSMHISTAATSNGVASNGVMSNGVSNATINVNRKPRGVNALDNFVIDDSMFRTDSNGSTNISQVDSVDTADPVSKRNGDQTNSMNGHNSIGGVKSGDVSYASDDSGSTDEDVRFARQYANVQGSKKAAPSRTVAAAKPAEFVKRKPDPAEAEAEVDWTTEPFLTIVSQLSNKYGVRKGLAKNALEAAAHTAGGINDLDVVYIEAEQRIKNALKPSPLQSATCSLPSAAAAAASSRQLPAAGQVVHSSSDGRFNNYKTVLCNHWNMDKKCLNGIHCSFAHGIAELRYVENYENSETHSPNSYYKVMLCKNYEADGHCPWGSSCLFAHGEEELRTPGEPIQQMRPREEESEASSLHEEPCDNQQCSAKLEFLLRKTGMCTKHANGLCRLSSKECKFAHSKKELKKMPKWEMCQKHMKRWCTLAKTPERCVYAHNKLELKRKPIELENKGKKQIAATGGRPIQSGNKYVPWAGDDKHPTSSRDTQECLICLGPLFEKKILLSCGHNEFHEMCISQWVNEGAASCPVCRKPAKLRDMYQPPAGFKPEEFPGLGLYH